MRFWQIKDFFLFNKHKRDHNYHFSASKLINTKINCLQALIDKHSRAMSPATSAIHKCRPSLDDNVLSQFSIRRTFNN